MCLFCFFSRLGGFEYKRWMLARERKSVECHECRRVPQEITVRAMLLVFCGEVPSSSCYKMDDRSEVLNSKQ